jgi:hypothetical protein
MVWDGVTSAVGSDARKRDDGDAKASSRSDDDETAPRRRNPKGGWHFAGAHWRGMTNQFAAAGHGRRMQSAGHDTRIHFSAAC